MPESTQLSCTVASVPLLLTAMSCLPLHAEDEAEHASRPARTVRASILTVAAVGDVLLHPDLQLQAGADPRGHTGLWAEAVDAVRSADIAYANLEGPAAAGIPLEGPALFAPGPRFDDWIYTGFPRFNYHPDVVRALADTGFDVVSTANNHILDRGWAGADMTIRELHRAGIYNVGARLSADGQPPWTAAVVPGPITTAWIGCTYGTNGPRDVHEQVALCYESASEIEQEIQRVLAEGRADAVIVTPHWGLQYTYDVHRRQRRLARRFVDAGAIAIVGSHPHVEQPWEMMTAANGREAVVAYSLGNFVAWHRDSPVATRRGAIMLFDLQSDRHGDVVVGEVRRVPTMMSRHRNRLGLRLFEPRSVDDGPRTAKTNGQCFEPG